MLMMARVRVRNKEWLIYSRLEYSRIWLCQCRPPEGLVSHNAARLGGSFVFDGAFGFCSVLISHSGERYMWKKTEADDSITMDYNTKNLSIHVNQGRIVSLS
jgi:hypothetical protein